MAMSIPLPDDLDDVHAAAIVNPGMSAWMTLSERGAPVKGETVLIQGATGVAGQLAIQVARHLGAKRIIASGRNVDALASADVDAIVRLTDSDDAIRTAYSAEVSTGIDLIVDYLWAGPRNFCLKRSPRASVPGNSQNPAGGGGRERRQHHHPPGALLRKIDLTLLAADSARPRLTASSPPFQRFSPSPPRARSNRR